MISVKDVFEQYKEQVVSLCPPGSGDAETLRRILGFHELLRSPHQMTSAAFDYSNWLVDSAVIEDSNDLVHTVRSPAQ
jgi:hypothetical protein